MALNPLTGIHLRREIWSYTEQQAHREIRQVKTKTETGVTLPQTKDRRESLEIRMRQGKKGFFSGAFRETTALLTP